MEKVLSIKYFYIGFNYFSYFIHIFPRYLITCTLVLFLSVSGIALLIACFDLQIKNKVQKIHNFSYDLQLLSI